jgi:hypothetical protein
MSIAVEIWRATHTGGSKFYQVFRFKCGGVSFALYHYGAIAVDSGIGKVGAGQVLIETLVRGTSAGLDKQRSKHNDGYRDKERTETKTFSTMPDFTRWLKDNIAEKGRRLVQEETRKMEWLTAVESASAASAPIRPVRAPERPLEPDEPNHVKHAEWGAWG